MQKKSKDKTSKIMISETNLPSSKALKSFSMKLLQLKARLQREHGEVG
jgi:hypothetical protein